MTTVDSYKECECVALQLCHSNVV